MAISEAYSGSTAIGGTAWSLTANSTAIATVTDDGVYQCYLDLNALAKADVYVFKVLEKVTSSATQRVVYSVTFANAQTEPDWVSPSLILMHGWDMTLLKSAGTDRTVDWSIRAIT